jgi:hypothetical protein
MHARDIRINLNNITSGLISSLIITGLITMVLSACTGSFEGGASSARLVFAIPAAGTINCLNAASKSTPVTVSIGLLITNSNLEQNGQLSNCESRPTDSAPYDLLTTAAGDRIVISLPGSGRLEVRSNQANNLVIATLRPKDATEAFCPTRLALSPNAQRIAVLDDPDAPKDPNNPTASERICTNPGNRSPRVLVFDLSSISASKTTLEPVRVATGDLSGTFQSARSAGPLALTINDIQAFVIAPITTYGIFKLNKDDDARVNPTALNLADLRILDNTLRLDLTNIGSRLLLTFNSNFGNAGGAYFIDPNTLVPEAVALNGAPLRANTRAVWNKRPNDSLIAYLQPNQVVFQRLTSPASNSRPQPISNPIDAAFTSDGYAWVLQPGGVARFDVTNLTTINNSSFASLNLNARAIGTFIQQ